GAHRDCCATMQTLNLVHMIPIRWPRTEIRAFCKNPPASPSSVLQNTPCAPYPPLVLRPSPLQVFRLPCDWHTPKIQPPPAGAAPPFREPTPPGTVAYASDW